MERIFKKVVALMAVAVVVVFGAQACSSDDPFVALLGNYDGPSESSIVGGITCTGCDGEVEMTTSAGKGLPSGDGDFDALMDLLYELTWGMSETEDIYVEYGMLLEDHFDGVTIPEGQIVRFGPLTGTIDLSEACAPGTGVLIVTTSETYEGLPPEMAGAKGPAPWGQFIGDYDRYDLVLSNCQIEGNLLDFMTMGISTDNTEVALSGRLTLTEEQDFEVSDDWTFDGLITINPGLSEPMVGGVSDPTPVWGYSTPLRIDASAHSSYIKGFDSYEGGACYGGTNAASAEDCDGIFIDGEEIIGFWDD
ncbi:MAG: hypothetical protein KDH09_10095 [Chrysiogenetes bacterium]|nr:hypothetical protein [Chrysiogenetes bacterium]